jgi:hypothetical protein
MLESNTIAGSGIARILMNTWNMLYGQSKIECDLHLEGEESPYFLYFLFLLLPRRGPLYVLLTYTCSKILSFHSLTKIIKKEAYFSSKTALLRLNIHGEVFRYLNTHFPYRFVAQAGPMSRPSLTPNLTRIYFYYADLLRIV